MKTINFLDVRKYPRTDIGLAQMFHDAFEDELLFCADVNTWYSWNGKNWQVDDCLYRCECAKKLYSAVMIAVYSTPDAVVDEQGRKFYQGLSSKKIRDRIIEDARSIQPITCDRFDKSKFLFNCQNGTYDFTTNTLKPHDKNDYLTRISPVNYDPEADCPRFKQYLQEVMQGDDRSIDYLLKIAAYCLTGDVSQECFFVLYGDKTRNGKSTFVSTLTTLMGNYASNLRPASITRKNISTGGSNATPDIAKLVKSRLATVSELEDGMMLDISLIKTMTGGNALSARELYSKEFSFVPQFKILIDTNYLPKMTDDSIFNSDRIHILCFDRHFEPEERDIHLKETLQTEIDGIFNLIASYYPKLRAEGFIMPNKTKETIEQYALVSNNIRQFVSQCVWIKKGSYEKKTDVYKAYQKWCDENTYKVMGSQKFFQKMADLGFVLTQKALRKNDRGESANTIWFKDITLTEQDDDNAFQPVLIRDTAEGTPTLETFMKEIDTDEMPFAVDDNEFEYTEDGDLPY